MSQESLLEQSSLQLPEEPSREWSFQISPLVRLTLGLLYMSLVLPLPFLAQATHAAVSPQWIAVGGVIGFLLLYGALTERVLLTNSEIQVTYPRWVPSLFRRRWRLAWSEIQALKPRSTGQGGIVYYFLSESGEAFLLPMRVAGFAKLVRGVEAKTGIDTTDVRPLSQPWMYLILLVFTFLLLLVDGWAIATAIEQGLA